MLTIPEGTTALGGHLSSESAEYENELVHFAFMCFDLDSLYLPSSTYLFSVSVVKRAVLACPSNISFLPAGPFLFLNYLH